tara:strand:+ start:1571 stop:1888 length:318 start_codon:yes stop_codon:yes gene_type:complete
MNQISECCDAPLVYHIWEKSDQSIGYEPWDFCPQCLECCSGYDPKERAKEEYLSKILLTDKERRDVIARSIEKSKRENESLDSKFNIENDCVCSCGKQKRTGCTD